MIPIPVVIPVAPIASAITVTVLERLVPLPRLMLLPGLMLSPGLLPRIRLLRRKRTLPAKLLIPLPSVVVPGIVIAIGRRTKLHPHSKLLCLRLRRSRQGNRAHYKTNCYALHYHRLYAREFHNNLLLTSH